MFIPATKKEIENLNWKNIEILLISGDTYIDSSFSGISIIGKLLLEKGFKVAILSQPEWRNKCSDYLRFDEFGIPDLYFGISAGMNDSMVSNYTASMKKRKRDDLTPGEINNRRPDRSCIVYSNLVKSYFKDKRDIVLGGIEASLRRLTHYDVWEDRLRKPILLDSKANYLIYGMAEITTFIFSIILKLKNEIKDWENLIKRLRGLCFVEKDISKYKIINYEDILESDNLNINWDKFQSYLKSQKSQNNNLENINIIDYDLEKFYKNFILYSNFSLTNKVEFIQNEEFYILLPSYEECTESKKKFEIFYKIFMKNCDPKSSFSLVQKVGDRYIIHNKPQRILSQQELDYIYELPYEYDAHPFYKAKGKIKALETIKNSITITRGCLGSCTFCSINMHQGKEVISRSLNSIIREVERITKKKGFNGIIYDLGGPTANLYGVKCEKMIKFGECKNKECLFPEVCNNLIIDHNILNLLYSRVQNIKGIKKIFIQSGIRYDLILKDKKSGILYLNKLIRDHIGGQLKIAPEHINEKVIKLMKKISKEKLINFLNLFNKLKKENNKNVFLTFYLIAAFPGCSIKEQIELKKFFRVYCNNFIPEQVQIFQPTPSTYATLIYYLEKDPESGEKIFVEKRLKYKNKQKKILFSREITSKRNKKMKKE